jgi:hypothetical protein
MARITAKAWTDPAFKARLFSETKKVLREYGFEIPDDVSVVIHESTAAVRHIVLPQLPEGFVPGQIPNMDVILPEATAYYTIYPNLRSGEKKKG